MSDVHLHQGDCREVMAALPAESVEAIVTDPPYGLSFMGKGWDHGVPGVPFWQAALRVAKPGTHLLAFGGTRTHHRLMAAIEDAGWEIRDCLMWLYGQGFPKSHDIGKAIDKAAGAEREVVGVRKLTGKARVLKGGNFDGDYEGRELTAEHRLTVPATDAAKEWDGWQTALKPAWEPIIVARKPLIGTVAENVLAHGCGGINVDGCRLGADWATDPTRRGWQGGDATNSNSVFGNSGTDRVSHPNAQGRWPANLVLDEEAAALLDEMSGVSTSPVGAVKGQRRSGGIMGAQNGNHESMSGHGDTGGASRFFYVAKASKRDRDEGLEGMPKQFMATMGDGIGEREHNPEQPSAWVRNHHPTVKPTSLMRWLVRLVTPPNGTVLDPFCGSGSTLKAAVLEGFSGIGIDTEAEYIAIAERRIAHAQAQMQARPEAVPGTARQAEMQLSLLEATQCLTT